MKMKETLREIINTLIGQRKTKVLGSLLKKSLEMESKDYKEFNCSKRLVIQETVLDSILNTIEKGENEELNNEAKNSLENFPKIEQKVDDIDTKSEEANLIQSFRDIEIEEKYVRYDDPEDILSTILKMSFDDSILFHFLKHQFGLRDLQDYNQIKKSFFNPLHHALKESLGEQFKDKLYLLIFRLSRLYGVPPLKKLKPEDVYTKGYEFYKGHENELTITFSTSSGLLNPLERYGTEEFIKRYSISLDKVDDLLLKNPYRVDNFSKGILNKNINSKRVYIWERKRTFETLKETLNMVPRDRKQKFLDDAVNLLAEAFMFEKIKIIEINRFDEWMRRFTRNAKGEIMLSIRGTKSKRISHAIHINFDIESMRKRERFIQRILNILAVPTGLAHPVAGLFTNLMVLGEDIFYSILESTLQKSFDLEKEIVQIGKVIKGWESLGKEEAWKKSEKVIEEMIK